MFKNDKSWAEQYSAGDPLILRRIAVLEKAVDNVIQYGSIETDRRQPVEEVLHSNPIQPPKDKPANLMSTAPAEDSNISIASARRQLEDYFNNLDEAA